jgi:hypothetical protein
MNLGLAGYYTETLLPYSSDIIFCFLLSIEKSPAIIKGDISKVGYIILNLYIYLFVEIVG